MSDEKIRVTVAAEVPGREEPIRLRTALRADAFRDDEAGTRAWLQNWMRAAASQLESRIRRTGPERDTNDDYHVFVAVYQARTGDVPVLQAAYGVSNDELMDGLPVLTCSLTPIVAAWETKLRTLVAEQEAATP